MTAVQLHPTPIAATTTEITLNSRRWSPSVRDALQNILNDPRNAGRSAVLSFDNTCMAFDIGAATLEALKLNPKNLPDSAQRLMGVDMTAKGNLASQFKDFPAGIFRAESSAEKMTDLYCWLLKAMEGLTPAKIAAATASMYTPSATMEVYPRPHPYYEMVDLIGKLQAARIDVWILSSSNPWSVRWAVNSIINPELEQKNLPLVPLDRVVGLGVKLRDVDGKIKTDRELVLTDDSYLSLDPERLSKLQLTGELDSPICAFEGKASICRALIGSSPVLAVGNTVNDFPMFNLAENRLLVAEPANEPKLREFAGRQADHNYWLHQPVGYIEWSSDMTFKPA